MIFILDVYLDIFETKKIMFTNFDSYFMIGTVALGCPNHILFKQ